MDGYLFVCGILTFFIMFASTFLPFFNLKTNIQHKTLTGAPVTSRSMALRLRSRREHRRDTLLLSRKRSSRASAVGSRVGRVMFCLLSATAKMSPV